MTESERRSIAQQKRALRAACSQKREALSAAERTAAGREICRHIAWMLKQHERAGIVALYAGIRSEVDVLTCTKNVLQIGWRVAVPKTDPKTRELLFYSITQETDWVYGNYGIREPNVTNAFAQFIPNSDLDIIVTPGLAFTRAGLRLGYGGGYYDRLFAQHPRSIRVGAAYECQWMDDIPALSHDMPMHYVVTEAGVHRCPHVASS